MSTFGGCNIANHTIVWMWWDSVCPLVCPAKQQYQQLSNWWAKTHTLYICSPWRMKHTYCSAAVSFCPVLPGESHGSYWSILTTTGWLAKKFTDILSNMQSALVTAYILMALVLYFSEYKLILCVFFNPNWINPLNNNLPEVGAYHTVQLSLCLFAVSCYFPSAEVQVLDFSFIFKCTFVVSVLLFTYLNINPASDWKYLRCACSFTICYTDNMLPHCSGLLLLCYIWQCTQLWHK